MTETDEQLIELCKEGNDLAFQELVRRYSGALYGFVRQYIRALEDVEDVVQDSFFKAWKNMRRFDSDKKFKPWLYTIARNTSLDHIKKKKAVSFSELDDNDNDIQFADTLADPEPIAHQLFEQAEIKKNLDTVLEILHPDHRAILIMHYHYDMTFDEIADSIGKSMNTVKSWHRRSLIKLQKHMHPKT
ncbi:MAG: RNA polymerase sigma factor [Candidatus Taylorbacteria bacterium]